MGLPPAGKLRAQPRPRAALLAALLAVAGAPYSPDLADLDLSRVRYSNLYGKGPDTGVPAGIRFHGATQVGKTLLDLVIVAEDEYEPSDVSQNINSGVNHQIGSVNARVGSTAKLMFKFFRSGTPDPVTVDFFYLTFFIVDGEERLQMFEFDHYCMSPDTRLEYKIYKSPRSVAFKARAPNSHALLPSDPHHLSQREKDQAVTFYFKNTSSIPVNFWFPGPVADSNSNLMFSGTSSLSGENCFSWGGARGRGGSERGHTMHSVVPRFRKIERGTCADAGGLPITTRAECEAAARDLDLADTSVATSADLRRPEGCYALENKDGLTLWLSVNRQNKGNGAETSEAATENLRHPLCSVGGAAAAASPTGRPHTTSAPASPTAATSTTGRPRTTSAPYKCRPDARFGSWTLAEREWCCLHKGVGCQTTTTATTTSLTATATFSCGCEHAGDERCKTSGRSWPRDKRAWCCAQHGVGCPTSCDVECTMDSHTATCRERIGWAMHNLFQAKEDPCARAYDRVLTDCGACSACEADDTCPATSTTSGKPAAGGETAHRRPAAAPEPCDCAAGRDHWSAAWSDERRARCCKQCSFDCTPTTTTLRTTAATTSPTTPPPPTTTTLTATATTTTTSSTATATTTATTTTTTTATTTTATTTTTTVTTLPDCFVPVDPSAWPQWKQEWCCKRKGLGCTSTSTTTHAYNCQAGLFGLEIGWSAAKKVWCCRQRSVGCPTTTATATATTTTTVTSVTATATSTTTATLFDCVFGLSNWASVWADDKQQWCCEHRRLGCPQTTAAATTTSRLYDCGAGFANWQVDWSFAKKEWCCSMERLGCEVSTTTTTEHYDCEAAWSNWENDWSHWKKAWCCKRFDKGCATTSADPYECHTGLTNWRVGWADGKKEWCCKHRSLGCEEDLAALKPYDCQGGLTLWHQGWPPEMQEWCCRHERLGCADGSVLQRKSDEQPGRLPGPLAGGAGWRLLAVHPAVTAAVVAVATLSAVLAGAMGLTVRMRHGRLWRSWSADRTLYVAVDPDKNLAEA